MAVEAKRGCGFRKVGGLYLVGGGFGIACDRLPIELDICPCCGAGIKQSLGWTWIDPAKLLGGNHVICTCPAACPLCNHVAEMGKTGLLWIGKQFYNSIADFEKEAATLGVSRRIGQVPRGFKLGETWVMFAHPKGVLAHVDTTPGLYGDEPVAGTETWKPAIFRVWRPTGLERIYRESDRDSEAVQADIKRGITPVYVPDGDKDHQGSAYDKDTDEKADK